MVLFHYYALHRTTHFRTTYNPLLYVFFLVTIFCVYGKSPEKKQRHVMYKRTNYDEGDRGVKKISINNPSYPGMTERKKW